MNYAFHFSPKSHHKFWLLFKENLSPKLSKNRPIWSRWAGCDFEPMTAPKVLLSRIMGLSDMTYFAILMFFIKVVFRYICFAATFLIAKRNHLGVNSKVTQSNAIQYSFPQFHSKNLRKKYPAKFNFCWAGAVGPILQNLFLRNTNVKSRRTFRKGFFTW